MAGRRENAEKMTLMPMSGIRLVKQRVVCRFALKVFDPSQVESTRKNRNISRRAANEVFEMVRGPLPECNASLTHSL